MPVLSGCFDKPPLVQQRPSERQQQFSKHQQKQKQREIWEKVQREAIWRRKSEWVREIRGVDIFLVAKTELAILK